MMKYSGNNTYSEATPYRSHTWVITRRDFIKITGASILAVGTGGCHPLPAAENPMLTKTAVHTTTKPTTVTLAAATPTKAPLPTASAPSPTPQPALDTSHAKVAFVKTTDRTEGVRRAIHLLGINPLDGKTVLLKPNFNSADPTPGSTHNDVLRTLVESLWEMGARSITVADRSGMGNTRQVMERKGIPEMAQALGFDTQVLDELEADDWELITPSESHWAKGFLFARPFLEADAIVQTCCLKTHSYGGHFTLSLKNSVGMVAKFGKDGYGYMQELHSSPNQREMIAEINTAYHPALVVIDGVEAFLRGGPGTGERAQTEVMLAGTDRTALDAVGVAILRAFGTTPEVTQGRIFEQAQIARAVSLGLGISRPEDINLLTDDAPSAAYAAQIQEILLSA